MEQIAAFLQKWPAMFIIQMKETAIVLGNRSE